MHHRSPSFPTVLTFAAIATAGATACWLLSGQGTRSRRATETRRPSNWPTHGPVCADVLERLGGVVLGDVMAEVREQMASRRQSPLLTSPQTERRALLPRNQVQQEVIVDPEELREEIERMLESARTQGYAEGYVDGIARRDDGTSAN